MKIGVHTPPQGATQRFHDVAAALGAAAITYLWDCNPGDTRPGQINIVRLPTPEVAEPPVVYLGRVYGFVEEWYASSVNPIFVPGNEPDLEGPWQRANWEIFLPEYMRAIRQQWPAITLCVPAFSVANSGWMTADLAGLGAYVAAHCYWPADHPEWIDDRAWGGAWRYAHETGVRTLITEVNSNPTSPAQIARWCGGVAPDVIAATLFGADLAASQWPAYDVTPNDAATLAALIVAPQPAPPPPPAPLPSPPIVYSAMSAPHATRSVPRDVWVATLANLGAANAGAIVDAYIRYAAITGYDANLALAQACDECDWFRHARWTQFHNPAGIGITGDAVLGVNFVTLDRGVQAHLALLNCYFGDGTDPWGVLTAAGYGGFREGFATLGQLNGVWAVPGTTYAQTIAQIADQVVGRVPPAQTAGISGDQVAAAALVYLGASSFVDEGVMVPAYYHCEEFTELANEDAGVARVRYPDALTHALALPLAKRPGMVGEVGFWRGAGWSVAGHTGIFLRDGGVISALANVTITYGWERDPGYMGCAYFPGVGTNGGEMPLPSDGALDMGEVQMLWTALGAVWNPQSGIFTDWLAKRRAGVDYGIPVGGEMAFEGGARILLLFTSGVVAQWTQGDGRVRWLATMPA